MNPQQEGSGACGTIVIVLLLLSNVVALEEENNNVCTLCPDDAPFSTDKSLLTVDWPVAAMNNCSELNEYARSFQVDSEECTRVQAIGMLCGCPVPTDSCWLCPNGGNVTLAEKKLPFLQNNFDGVVPTCQLLESFLHSIAANTTQCVEAQLLHSVCGCPLRETACRFCADGKNMSDPQQALDGYTLDVRHWDLSNSSSPPTCELWSSAVSFLFEEDSANCRASQSLNYACGCTARTYNRETTWRRVRTLVWLPRVSAVMSIFGSLYIIINVLKKPTSEQTTQHHLLLAMSCFDCVSSVWWSLTTLPIPEDTGMYGAKGNDATCTAQGFFIQLGLTSPFLNLSLAVYYWFVIGYGWKAYRIRKWRWALFGAPVSVGLGLALAGIPRYAMDQVMCYLPENGELKRSINRLVFLVVPICFVIVLATTITFFIYLKVYHQQQASQRWSMTSNAYSLRRRVFWQGFWYLMCFYASWPALVIVTMVETGLYERYGFLCLALFLAPIQGFTNFVAYARPKLLQHLNDRDWCC